MRIVRKLMLALLLFVCIVGVSTHTLASSFSMDISEENYTTFDGITHREIVAIIDRNGIRTEQVVHVLSANPLLNPQVKVVTGDNYPALTFGMSNMYNIAERVDNRYEQYTVLGGVNADFYNMTTGMPSGVYVRAGEVIFSGIGNHPAIGFKEDGSVIIGLPCFDGFEVKVYASDHTLKYTKTIAGINRLPQNNEEVTAYFSNHDQSIPEGVTKVLLSATEIKLDGYDTRYFGKGEAVEFTTGALTPSESTLIITTHHQTTLDAIEVGDTLTVQSKMGCGFEDVQWVMGLCGGELVRDGASLAPITWGAAPTSRHPRTAVGIKPDGTILFITIDGRNFLHGREGVTLNEVADIMLEYGAVTAWNLDGGGSTTMLLREGDAYAYKNMLSDGRPRSLSNGLLFVKVDDAPLPDPAHVSTLSMPGNFRINQEDIFLWDEVDNRAGFIVRIGVENIPTGMRSFDAKTLPPGLYDIQVQAIGDNVLFENSPFSSPITYLVLPREYENIIALLERFAKHQLP